MSKKDLGALKRQIRTWLDIHRDAGLTIMSAPCPNPYCEKPLEGPVPSGEWVSEVWECLRACEHCGERWMMLATCEGVVWCYILTDRERFDFLRSA